MSKKALKHSLETFLLAGSISVSLETSVIRASRLGAYAYGQAKGEMKAFYKADYLAAATRHRIVKSQLLPLIKRWRDAGIDVLLMKGFYLAEFVYEVPAERFYGDVDILIHPKDTSQAKAIAEQGIGHLCILVVTRRHAERIGEANPRHLDGQRPTGLKRLPFGSQL